jgi:hypothetical protein
VIFDGSSASGYSRLGSRAARKRKMSDIPAVEVCLKAGALMVGGLNVLGRQEVKGLN